MKTQAQGEWLTKTHPKLEQGLTFRNNQVDTSRLYLDPLRTLVRAPAMINGIGGMWMP
jgi:hypothetical protein